MLPQQRVVQQQAHGVTALRKLHTCAYCTHTQQGVQQCMHQQRQQVMRGPKQNHMLLSQHSIVSCCSCSPWVSHPTIHDQLGVVATLSTQRTGDVFIVVWHSRLGGQPLLAQSALLFKPSAL